MGFTVTEHRRKTDLVAELIRSEENHTVLAHSLRGNHLWKLVRLNHQGKLTTCILLDSLASHHGEWGYKDLSEFMGQLVQPESEFITPALAWLRSHQGHIRPPSAPLVAQH